MRVHYPAAERGQTNIGWLNSQHSFSFGDFYDPARHEFRALRVINDDRIAGGGGFPTHGHRDMEILTWVTEGGIRHRDSTGGEGVITPGELQRMTAGRGIMHSEFNASKTDLCRLLQIWLTPTAGGLPPTYEQKRFADADRQGRWQVVASRDGRDGSLKIATDADLSVTELAPQQTLSYVVPKGRHAWIQIASGSVEVDGQTMSDGDGLAISNETAITLRGIAAAQVLLFDLG